MQKPNTAYRYCFITTLLLTMAGIATSSYLLLSHYRNYTDAAYASFCAISKSINCDTVAQSPWSIAGGLPVALIGLFGYIFFFILLCHLSKQKAQNYSLWIPLLFISGIFTCVSIFYAYISASKIHSFCILCIVCYGINFLLFFECWIICRRLKVFPTLTNIKEAVALIKAKKVISLPIFLLFLTFLTAKILLPQYWNIDATTIETNIPRGYTETGNPWIGSENPTVIIEEFSDYQCFQCSKMHFLLRRLIAKYPNNIRLVHRHYPLDHDFNPTVVPDSFHIGSGKMALLAIYASTQNKFWEMNDALFQYGRSKESFNTKDLANMTGLSTGELHFALSDSIVRKRLNLDIWTGMKQRITVTPTFLIEGKLYPGTIPEDVLNNLIQQR